MACCTLAVVLLLSVQELGDWAQWRGPGGLGRGEGADPPRQWSAESSQVEWTAGVPGKGLSSPIVHRGRVYATTAAEVREDRVPLDRSQLGLGVFLLVVVGVTLVGSTRRGLGAPRAAAALAAVASLPLASNDLSHWPGSGRTLGTGMLIAATLLVSILAFRGRLAVRGRREAAPIRRLAAPAVLLAIGWSLHALPAPARYGLLLELPWIMAAVLAGGSRGWSRSALDEVCRWTSRMVPLAVGLASAWSPELYWPESTSFHVWGRSAGVLCLGAVAVGDALLSGRGRRLGALALIVIGAAAVWFTPLGGMGETVPLWKRLLCSAPALLGAVWLGSSSAPTRAGTPVLGLALAALCVAVFLRANYWQSRLRTQALVLCWDLRTGSELWRRSVGTMPTGSLGHHLSSHATPTPCAAGDELFVDFGSVVASLDRSGSVRWALEDPGFVERSVYGAGASPLLFEDLLIIVRERERGPDRPASQLRALDRATGRARWRVELEAGQDSYGTPILVEDEAGPHLLTASWRMLIDLDPRDGRERWRWEVPAEEVVTSLVHEDGLLVLAGGSHRGIAMALALRGEQPPRPLWQTRRGTPDCSSPVLVDGRLYTVTDTGMLHCFEARTGRILWRERLGGGLVVSSLVAAGGALYVSDDAGSTWVVALGEEYRLLARNELGCPVHASPALSPGRILLRTPRRIWCLAGSAGTIARTPGPRSGAGPETGIE